MMLYYTNKGFVSIKVAVSEQGLVYCVWKEKGHILAVKSHGN